jgi:hypothetical protein
LSYFRPGVFLIRKTLTSGSHLSDAAVRAAPRPRIKCAVSTARRHPDSAAPFRPTARTASPRPVPTAPSPLSEAMPPSVSEAHRCPAVSTVATFVHGERRPSPPLAVFRPWSVELTSPSLLPVAGPPPATVAPPHRKNAAAEPVFSPSPSTRSSGELFSPSPCPAGSLTVAGRTGRGRPGKRRPRAAHTGHASAVAVGHARAVHMGRADAMSVGHAPLCNWAEREFGPVTLDLVFLISEYIQILANLKICVGFI